jgi:hypothetical protein
MSFWVRRWAKQPPCEVLRSVMQIAEMACSFVHVNEGGLAFAMHI